MNLVVLVGYTEPTIEKYTNSIISVGKSPFQNKTDNSALISYQSVCNWSDGSYFNFGERKESSSGCVVSVPVPVIMSRKVHHRFWVWPSNFIFVSKSFILFPFLLFSKTIYSNCWFDLTELQLTYFSSVFVQQTIIHRRRTRMRAKRNLCIVVFCASFWVFIL